jgi:hypothetical protein
MTRPLYEIQTEIVSDWKKPDYCAVPYLEAMSGLDKITDNYFLDSGKSIVLYFLANSSTWKGEVARRIKAELKTICNI